MYLSYLCPEDQKDPAPKKCCRKVVSRFVSVSWSWGKKTLPIPITGDNVNRHVIST